MTSLEIYITAIRIPRVHRLEKVITTRTIVGGAHGELPLISR
jgi:hypothetical protein